MNFFYALLMGCSLCVLPSASISAQSGTLFSLEDLISFYGAPANVQQAILAERGFTFDEDKTEEGGGRAIKVHYYSKKKNAQAKNSMSDMLVTRMGENPAVFYEANYMFFDREAYYNFRKTAVKMGFVEQVGRIYPTRFEYIYMNDTYKIVCYTATERSYTMYGIRVFRK